MLIGEEIQKLPYRTVLEAVQSEASGKFIHLAAGSHGAACAMSRDELLTGACQTARLLREKGVEPGERVLLVLPTGKPFLWSVFGTWYAGGAVVPLACPPSGTSLEPYLRKLAAIIRTANPRVIVGMSGSLAALSELGAVLSGVQLVSDAAITAQAVMGDYAPLHEPQAVDVAHIQFTSGSTGFPRGACITHGNLVANLHAVGVAIKVMDDDSFVSWLPVHHDMGFIGGLLFALFHNGNLHLIPTETFLRNPALWLQVITAAQATLSPAPPFAYDLLASRVRADRLEGVNLSTWRHAWIGAEPIFLDTLNTFNDRFRAYGLRENVLHPCYGLAEATLAVTHTALNTPPKAEWIKLNSLRSARYAESASPNDPGVAPIISCGTPITDTQVHIVGEDGAHLADRRQGRVLVRGTSVMRGYLDQAEQPFTSDGWLDTGDLGFMLDGELYVTGRAKDLIIRGGANIHPQDIEHAAQSVAGVRLGRTAAFSIVKHDESREEIIVVVETKERDKAKRAALIDEVMREVIRQAGVRADRVELAPPGFIPKTTSGKTQRSLCRDKLLRVALTTKTEIGG